MASSDVEGGPKKVKRTPSSGKLLVDDPGWTGPFNRMVWAHPNSILYLVVLLGCAAYFLVKSQGLSTNAFLGAAVVEVLLSTDNICLFHQIFEHFKVPREVRPGLLFVGTPFMVIVRGVLFFSLKGIYDYIYPLMFAIGLFCCYQGFVVMYMTCTGEEEEDEDPSNSMVVKWGKRMFGERLLTTYHGSAYAVYFEGALRLTPAVLCLAVIEVTDIAFCIDGVSTIFMVDHKHVVTLFIGDIVAACLVRGLYPQMAGTVELFPDLNYSVAVVLMLVGVDMCAGVVGYDFPPGSLALAMGILFTIGISTSILRGTCRTPGPDALKSEEEREASASGYGSNDAPLLGTKD